ncbi:MAG: M16 family metallopeptidase [Desulfohalobiaceae bacterium]
MFKYIFSLALVMTLTLPGQLQGSEDYLQNFQSRISEFSLDNGMRFLVLKREQAPVVSFVTLVQVGSKHEPAGKTGLAHFLEHMAFKGTERIGSKDWEKEQELLERLDQAYLRWQQARREHGEDSEQARAKKQEFSSLQEQAGELSESNEFSRLIEQHGGQDLNAATSKDYTMYHCSLPAHKAELWFSLEADRLQDPVWREFYREKQVIQEERRSRVDSNPQGRLLENFLAQAYLAHPYRHPVLSWEQDIQDIQKQDLEEFRDRFYQARNITVVVAGDIDPQQVKNWAGEYFSDLKTGESLQGRGTKEPEQKGPREFRLKEEHEPVLVRGYQTVRWQHPDYLALQILSQILTQGRTSRLYTSLVQEQTLAQNVFAMQGYPGEVDQALFLIFALPAHGVETAELIKTLDQELQNIRQEGVTQEELQRAKTNLRADLVRSLDSNLGLAKSLAKAQGLHGDWRLVFTRLEALQAVDAEQVRQAAEKYLQQEKSTQGRIVPREDKEE